MTLLTASGFPTGVNLPPDLLNILREVLGKHTGTKESCLFCLWEGYGWLYDSRVKTDLVLTGSEDVRPNDTSSPAVRSLLPQILEGSKLHLPARNYYLLRGPLDAALDFGWMLTPENFVPQSPNLFWPQDHAWCVASEIDLFCTLVAGSEALADSLIADPRLEAWRVSARDTVTWNSDQINT